LKEQAEARIFQDQQKGNRSANSLVKLKNPQTA
jgi:hypothetical protein